MLFLGFIVVLSREVGGEIIYTVLTVMVFYLTICFLNYSMVLKCEFCRHNDRGGWLPIAWKSERLS